MPFGLLDSCEKHRRSYGLRQFYQIRLSVSFSLGLLVLFVLLSLIFPAQDSQASDLPGEKLSQEISSTIMSPYCPGRTLSACPSTKALELRKKIKGKAIQGQGRQEILSWLDDTYGDSILAAPKAGVARLLAWTVPVIFVLVGLGLSILKARSLKRQPESAPDALGAEKNLGEMSKGESSSSQDEEFLSREIAQRLGEE